MLGAPFLRPLTLKKVTGPASSLWNPTWSNHTPRANLPTKLVSKRNVNIFRGVFKGKSKGSYQTAADLMSINLVPTSSYNKFAIMGILGLIGGFLLAKDEVHADDKKDKKEPKHNNHEKKDDDKEHENKLDLVLLSALTWDIYDRLILALVSTFTVGIGYFIAKPFIEYYHLSRAISKIRLRKHKRLQWDASLEEFYILYLKNWVLSVLTLGFYSILGYADKEYYTFVDKHLRWV